MGFFDNFAGPPTHSPMRPRKFVDIDGEKAQRRLPAPLQISPTVRSEDSPMIDFKSSADSDLRAKLSLISLEDSPVVLVRPNSPRKHESNRESVSTARKLVQDEQKITSSPRRVLKGMQKALSNRHFNRSNSADEEATIAKSPRRPSCPPSPRRTSCPPTSPRRSMQVKNLSNRLLGRAKNSADDTSTLLLPEDKPMPSLMKKTLSLRFGKSEDCSDSVASQELSAPPSTPVRTANARKLVFSTMDGLAAPNCFAASNEPASPPSSPTRASARKLVFGSKDAPTTNGHHSPPSSPLHRPNTRMLSRSNMEDLDAPSAEPTEDYLSSPSSTIRAISRNISWSNMDALSAPYADDENIQIARKVARPSMSPKRSPSKVKAPKVAICKMPDLIAPSLDGDESAHGSISPRRIMQKKLAPCSAASVVSISKEKPKERSMSPMRSLVKKLSLRSLCSAGRASSGYDELTGESEYEPKQRMGLSRHLSLSKIDHSSGLNDAGSVCDRSAASTRSFSSVLRKTASLRGSCMSESSAVDSSTPEAAERFKSASPRRCAGRSVSPRRTPQKQTSGHIIPPPQHSIQVSSSSSNAPPSSPRRVIHQTPIKTANRRVSLQKQVSERTPTKSLHKPSSFDLPRSPVKKSGATARKLEPMPILKTPPSSPRRSSFATSPRRGSNQQRPHASPLNKVQSCRALTTPMSERRKFTSLADCIGEYDKIVYPEDEAPDGSSITGW